ncbi:2-dehydropantoate 2-reductase [Crossiella sp. SN42]|uniref:ketopantoate reductase family protein n=1 Tax=Crossiella sp. SN42 TaxID=2944808 RepID=UPI00207C82AD|nr:2-dehydropantoate 2-reductase [Crossiella sp. SN42]MCO1580655.1 2-dehydropantoate 2-reductase [Crossiella sp. SN42]
MASIGVLGPGGVGGLIAARLGAAGHEVTVVATERTAAEITAHGLSFQAPGAAPVVSHPDARPWLTAPVEVLVIAVKATELLAAVQRVPAAVLDKAIVLPLLNGIDHLPVLRASYPRATVLAASIAVEAVRHRPGAIEQLSTMADLAIADGTPEGVRAAELFRAAGLTVGTHPDEQTVLWRKLSFLDPFALLTTGADAPIEEALRRKPEWLRPLVDEAAAAAAVHGVDINADAVESRIRSLPGTMRSSMLRDRQAGRALELDAIAGPVIRALGHAKATTTVEVARTILGNS